MLRETACDCLACSRIGVKRENAVYHARLARSEAAICRAYYHHSSDTIQHSARETCNAGYYGSSYAGIHLHEQYHYYKHTYHGYRCPEQGCKYKTKSWSEMRRHTLSIHCQITPRYPCPEIGCHRHGDNGFKREDKLNEHIRKVHTNRVAPGRAGRGIRPAIANANNGAGYRA